MPATNGRLDELSLDLAWSLWTELGVPGSKRNHQDWSVDPEPLLLFTALWSHHDPRLRDEAMLWSVANRRLLSRARLRGLWKAAPDPTRAAFGPLAATIAAHAPGAWAGATTPWRLDRVEARRRVRVDRPAQLRLRLRSLFGVSARAEIMHALVAAPGARFAAGELADATGYTKANMSEELETLELAGLLTRTARANRALFGLRAPDRLRLLAAPIPARFVDWSAALRLVAALAAFDRERPAPTSPAAPVEAARLLKATAADRDRAGFPERPPDAHGRRLVDWLDATAHDYLGALSAGE